MKRFPPFLLLIFLLLTFSPSCTSATPAATAETVTVQYTAAATPWLANVVDCAGDMIISADLRSAEYMDLRNTELAIRIGQPADLTSPAYQIDTDDVLIIVNPQNPAAALSAEQVRGLFSGQIQNWQAVGGADAPVQVWTFAAREDIQQVFEQTALGGAPVTSLARLATGPEKMAQAIANNANAIGILSRRWKTGNVSEVYTVATVPVLALTPSVPQGQIADILACLQK
jgi:phosphate transport system substrate-binding protein